MMVRVKRTPHSSIITGWREWVSMPEIGVAWVKAKIDTGARTSSLHAFDVVEYEVEGQKRVRFRVKPWQENPQDAVDVDLPVHDRRVVRSSNGHEQSRIVVLLPLVLAGREISAEVTLSNRDAMGFRMLIGREALRNGYVVDPARSFLGGKPDKVVRRRNHTKR